MKLTHVARSRISNNSISSSSSKSSKDSSKSPPLNKPLLSDFDTILTPKKPVAKNNIYKVTKYDGLCEDSFKIEEIRCLRLKEKKLIDMLFSFICSIIFYNFETCKNELYYEKCNLKESTHFGILGVDKTYAVVEAFEFDLPKLGNSNILLYFKSNIVCYKTKCFKYKLFTYAYSPDSKTFDSVVFEINASLDVLSRKFLNGLNEKEVQYQYNLYGPCELDIKIDSMLELLKKEFTDPFYMFQFFSIVLWLFNEYVNYAIIILLITIISIYISIRETRQNLINIHEMAKIETFANKKNEINISSRDIVPGDLYEIPDEGSFIPCDTLLISGTLIINESILTGESIPVFKNNIPNSSLNFNFKTDSKHILYAGTKILQKKNFANKKCLGLAIATGFNSQKGNLIRTILYPPVKSFQFKKDSMKYVVFMGFVSIIGFFITLNCMIKANYSFTAVIKRGLDLVTITVPPSLPACLGIGIAFAVNRLKKYGIKCINRDGVNIAGQVDLVCFDKTGTLTEDFLDISGFVPIKYETGKFVLGEYLTSCKNIVEESYSFYKEILQHSNYFQDMKNLKLDERIKMLRLFYVECMASCHSITKVKNQFLGDPIDLKMFEATDWIIKESGDNDNHFTDNNNPLIFNFIRYKEEKDLDQLLQGSSSLSIEDEEKLMRSQYELGIVRKFEFSSNLQRMSVVVKNKNEDYFKIYTKGSPEKIRDLCREDTIPKNFDKMLSHYTNKGFRVLGLSMKIMKMDYIQSQKLKRENSESNMIFLGFLIFENKLKAKTTTSIDILRNAGLKLIMATGDNVLTAVSVSKECNMVDNKSEILSLDIIKKDSNENILLVNLINEHSRISLIEKSNIENEDLTEESVSYYSDDENNYNDNEEFLNYSNFDKDKDSFDYEAELKKKRSTPCLIKRNTLLTNSLRPEVLISDSEDDSEGDDYYDTSLIDRKILMTTKKEIQFTPKDSLKFEGNFDFSQLENTERMNKLTLAVTGKTFEFFYKYHKLYHETNKPELLFFENLFKIILNQAIVYARMSPENKAQLIECLKKDNVIVAMIGDGANDIGALKSADIGISLSLEDASIASNFTSSVPDISCLIKLFQEGKASFVTSIQCFKYMILYSMIQFISVTFLMIVGTYLSDNQFLSIDLFLIFPLAILISRTGASKFLTREKPNGNLFSYDIVFSISFQVLIVFIFQYISFVVLRSQIWYVENPLSDSPLFKNPTYENTIIYLISFTQYIITAVAFSETKPFKESIFSNYLLCFFITFIMMFSFYMMLIPDKFTIWLLDIKMFQNYSINVILFFFCVLNFVLSVVAEANLVPRLSQIIRKIRKKERKL